jgi:vitamin B12/bleomycin/antimicrobial peptide transport system ATP-binding/permease protein
MCRPVHCDGLPTIPEAAHSRSVEEIAKVLKKVGLGHLVEHLDEERSWDQTLSGGEKQRLAFARIFLHRPDIIVLDEATAALDSQSEGQLMGLLSREFEHATVVSVGHRSELEALHGRKIVLQRGRQGARLVSDFCRIPKPVLPSGRPRMGLLSRWNSSLGLMHRSKSIIIRSLRRRARVACSQRAPQFAR